MIVHDFLQGSDEWLNIRLGKFTASDFHILMGDSKTKKTLLLKKAAERITSTRSDQDIFSNGHTDRGHELENEARTAYELETGNTIKEVGFVELNEFVGCSPDGFINEKRGIEIKCMDNHGFLNAVTKSYIAPTHKTQMQFTMYVCDIPIWDYTLYNPNFPNPLHIITVEKNDEYIDKIKATIDECNKIIKSHIKSYEGLS